MSFEREVQDKWIPPPGGSSNTPKVTNKFSTSCYNSSSQSAAKPQHARGSKSCGPAMSYAAAVSKSIPKGPSNAAPADESNYNMDTEENFPSLASANKKPGHVNSAGHKTDIQSQIQLTHVEEKSKQNMKSQTDTNIGGAGKMDYQQSPQNPMSFSKRTSQQQQSPEEITSNSVTGTSSSKESADRTSQLESHTQPSNNFRQNEFSQHQENCPGPVLTQADSKYSGCKAYTEKDEDNLQDKTEGAGAQSMEANYSNDNKEMFEYFWHNSSPFSQWYRSKFVVNGKCFKTAEQYMMYQKALLFGDAEIAEMILDTKDPRQQKKLGREVRNFNEEIWQKHCFKIVKEGNRQKFSQNQNIRGHLYSTVGKILVEASPYDTIWGIGLEEFEEMAWSRATWQGKNLLGYALTEVRDELMKADGLLDS